MRRALPIAVIAVLLSSGCSLGGLLGPDDASGAGDRCDTLLTEPTGKTKPAGTTVLLADGSASSFARSDAANRQDWAAKLAARLPGDGADLVAIGLFGGAVDWQTEKLMPGKSRDAARTKNDMRDARACLVDDLSKAMRSTPDKPQTDVLRALAEGAEYVRQWPGSKSLYLATDGLSNTGCADLRAAAIGDMTAIPKMVTDCSRELPALDKSYTVQFIGVGNAAEGWADIKTPQRAWLVALWKALCVATKANCKDPDSAKPATVTSSGITPPTDADVAMPDIKIVAGNPSVLTVPASLLFDLDSYQLATGRSQDALQRVYDFLKSVHYSKVVVAGHTDSTGTPEHNRRLSRQRADTVAAKLRGQHFTDISTVGYASDRPACTPEYEGGHPDLIAMACNRRVEITVYN